MSLFSAVSIESLAAHIQQDLYAGGEVAALMRHLVLLCEKMEASSLSRDFLVHEAEYWNAYYLSVEERHFIAKRLFAFSRKGMMPVLHHNLTYFPEHLRSLPAQAVMPLLEFEPIAILVQELLAAQNLPKPIPIIAEQTTAKPEVTQSSVTPIKPEVTQASATPITPITKPTAQETSAAPPPEHSQATQAWTEIEEEVIVEADVSVAGNAIAGYDLEKLTQVRLNSLAESWEKLQQQAVPVLDLAKYEEALLPRLEKNFPHQLTQILQGMMHLYPGTQQKYALMCLKNNLLQYRKLITNPTTLLIVLSYGTEAGEILLRKLSKISQIALLNDYTYAFLLKNFEQALAEHAHTFRAAVENCKNRDDLLRFLAQYPLENRTTLERYPVLQIIAQVKAICHENPQNSADFYKLAAQYWEEGEANLKSHLQKILIEGPTHQQIHRSLSKVKDINQLCKELKKLIKIPETQQVARTIFQLVVTFLKGRQKVLLRDLQTGLNFVPNYLQERICGIIKTKLRKDLESKLQVILSGKSRPEKRWRKLILLLSNPQFQSPDIQLFGYPLEDFLSKLKKLSQAKGNCQELVEHILGKETPRTLVELVVQAHGSWGDLSTQKTVATCCQELEKLYQESSAGAILSLRRPVMDLLQAHGQINFSVTESKLTGYNLAYLVAQYYQNPGRVNIVLPTTIEPQVGQWLAKNLNEERARQLAKMQGEAGK